MVSCGLSHGYTIPTDLFLALSADSAVSRSFLPTVVEVVYCAAELEPITVWEGLLPTELALFSQG